MDALPTLERRLGDRIELNVRLACRVPASPVQATVLDLSHFGCRVAFRDLHVEPGGTITLEIGNGDQVAGEVVWSRASQAGIRFHRRLRSGTAIFLGIEQPPAPVVESAAEPTPSTGLVSHWYRRLTGAFSTRANRQA